MLCLCWLLLAQFVADVIDVSLRSGLRSTVPCRPWRRALEDVLHTKSTKHDACERALNMTGYGQEELPALWTWDNEIEDRELGRKGLAALPGQSKDPDSGPAFYRFLKRLDTLDPEPSLTEFAQRDTLTVRSQGSGGRSVKHCARRLVENIAFDCVRIALVILAIVRAASIAPAEADKTLQPVWQPCHPWPCPSPFPRPHSFSAPPPSST